MAVLPAYRSQGVGTRMLEYLVQAADERYPAISLSVSVNSPALRLYHRCGFAVVGEVGVSLTMQRLRGTCPIAGGN
jgi:ribosomal protein S18 acetylase RimI-like enzyme